MTYENNEKYIAELWINDKEEESFKKSYLRSLIEEYQGHGQGFDADTVDGKHWFQIENIIKEATKDSLKTFKIGNTVFAKTKEQYYIGFEAVKLYDPDIPETPEVRRKLPWSTVVYTGEDGTPKVPDLLEVITQLYNQTYLVSGQTNRYTYQEFIERLSNVEATTNLMDSHIKNGQFNADSVNGLRFYIYTPEQYADLKEKAELYENGNESYNNEYITLHSINNVFIIKTEEEIKNGGYPDGVYPKNPDTQIITKFYQFRVAEAVEEGHTGLYLQYKHGDSDIWNDMCPAGDFLDRDSLIEKIKEILSNREDYTLNSTSLKESLKNVNVND